MCCRVQSLLQGQTAKVAKFDDASMVAIRSSTQTPMPCFRVLSEEQCVCQDMCLLSNRAELEHLKHRARQEGFWLKSNAGVKIVVGGIQV